MAASLGVAPAVADRMMKLLQRQKTLVRVDVLLFHEDALQSLAAEVTAEDLGERRGTDRRRHVQGDGSAVAQVAIRCSNTRIGQGASRRMGESRVVL